MKARTQAYSYAHLISVAEIASAIAIAKRTAGVDELRKLTQYAKSGESSAALYPPHQQWQHGGDANRIGVPTGNPSSIWRALAAKVSGPHMSDKDAFNYPTAASTWHMLAADVYALAREPVWSVLEATALRELACRYSPELMGESTTPATQRPEPAAVEPAPAQQTQPQAAVPAPGVNRGTPKALSDVQEAEVVRLYQCGRGVSVYKLATQFSVSRRTIDAALGAAGVKKITLRKRRSAHVKTA